MKLVVVLAQLITKKVGHQRKDNNLFTLKSCYISGKRVKDFWNVCVSFTDSAAIRHLKKNKDQRSKIAI